MALTRARRLLADHRLFTALLLAGALLRAVTLIAYRPALLYQDSLYYLNNAAHLVPMDRKPAGYPLFLQLLPIGHSLMWVPLVQHLLALGIAVLLYATLLRVGLPRWAAALAAVPFVLDAYQLLIEQFVLSETLFEVFLAGAVVALLWRAPLRAGDAALAGVLLAFGGITRVIAVVLIAPAVLGVLALEGRRLLAVAALLAGFVVPVAGYAVWYHHQQGSYGIADAGGRFLYGRVAPFAKCDGIPAAERVLCPGRHPGWGPHEFAWRKSSPFYAVPAAKRDKLASAFAKRVIRRQPLDYAWAVTKDVAQGFGVKRILHGSRATFLSLWAFQPSYPKPQRFGPAIRAHGGSGGTSVPALASFLRAYQVVFATPGPLLFLGVLAALGSLVASLRGRSRPAGAAVLLGGLGFALALGPAMTHTLSPRYMLPTLVVLPGALAAGAVALSRSRAGRAPASAPAVGQGRDEDAEAQLVAVVGHPRQPDG